MYLGRAATIIKKRISNTGCLAYFPYDEHINFLRESVSDQRTITNLDSLTTTKFI